MVVARTWRASGCASCRALILRSFATSPTELPRRVWPPLIWAPQHDGRQVRRISNAASSSDQIILQDVTQEKKYQDSAENAEIVVDTDTAQDLPWYLKLASPEKEPRPLSERQRIPELPEKSPPILGPLIQHISLDLGLDDLALLDLRELEPPPALGANLIMLLGTARSEKHLHVSADRLCRWLRGKKLRPDADGLLGRNELKLKLKRKNRRAKLTGNPTADSDDDGVRTGWVCVNVGVVKSEDAGEGEAPNTGFVGFGRRTDSTRIVVQMLIEERREELDLEKLWRDILRRGSQAGHDLHSLNPSSSSTAEASGHISENFKVCKPSNSLQGNITQLRRFHTTTRRLITTPQLSSPAHSLFYDSKSLTSSPSLPKSLVDELDMKVAHALNSQNYDGLSLMIRPFILRIPEFSGDGWRVFLLRELRIYLENMEPTEALEHLGQAFDDYDSTPFLLGFYKIMSPYQSQAEYEAQMWLQCLARELGRIAGYPIRGLTGIFHQARLTSTKISTTAYKRLLLSILRDTKGSESSNMPETERAHAAMSVLKAMHDQGIDILNEEMLLLLQETSFREIENPNPNECYATSDSLSFPSLPPTPMQRRLHILMQRIDLPPFSENSRIRLLNFHASQHQWREFWDIWRIGPRHGLPHSEAMYRCMFEAVANMNHQRACCTALRTWIPEMDQESIPVDNSWELITAIMKCVHIADPDVMTAYSEDPNASLEWVVLWKRCVQRLEELERLHSLEPRPTPAITTYNPRE